MKIWIPDSVYNDLIEEKLYINKYNSSDFKYLWEINRYWKEFAFDVLDGLQFKNVILPIKDNLLIYIKNNYKILIENNHLDINIEDYIELNDYVTLREWLEEENNSIENNGDEIFLIQK